MNKDFFKRNKEFKIPAFVFDNFWRSKYATKKYVEKVIGNDISFGGKKVLDFGCGTGSYCFLFDSDKYVGVDTDNGRIDYAKKNRPRYDFRHMENDLNISDNFDCIFIVSTLHHLNDAEIRKYFEQFYKILKPGGSIIGMEPCLFPKSIFNNQFMKLVDRGKYIRFEKQYESLFGDLFNFKACKKFKRHFIYNEIFYFAYKNVS